jgi:hypothetical protein
LSRFRRKETRSCDWLAGVLVEKLDQFLGDADEIANALEAICPHRGEGRVRAELLIFVMFVVVQAVATGLEGEPHRDEVIDRFHRRLHERMSTKEGSEAAQQFSEFAYARYKEYLPAFDRDTQRIAGYEQADANTRFMIPFRNVTTLLFRDAADAEIEKVPEGIPACMAAAEWFGELCEKMRRFRHEAQLVL